MTFSYRVLAQAIAIASLTPVISISAFADESTDTVKLEDTVVTATRVETPLKDVIGDVTVITQEELATHKGQTLFEVLKAQPSIQFKSNGGVGTASSIFIRGANSNHVVLLVDGQRIGSVTLGSPNFNTIPADSIQRVEILYGSSATSLYGSDAIGGVVQVFTKANSLNTNSAYMTLAAGTENTKVVSGGANLVNNGTKVGINVSLEKTDSINATNEKSSKFESDKDGHKSKSINLGLSHTFAKEFELGANITASKSATQYDAANKKQTTLSFDNAVNKSVWTKHKIQDANIKLQYGESVNKMQIAGTSDGFWNSEQKQIQLDFDYMLPVGKLYAGYQNLMQEVDSTTLYEETQRHSDSYLLGYQMYLDRVQLQLNTRHDNFKEHDHVNTYSAGLAVNLLPSLRLGASYATGFQMPTFNQLYYPGWANPDLKPETSKNTEVFIEFADAGLDARITAYDNKINNLKTSTAKKVENVDIARIKGVSFKSSYTLDDIAFGTSYDYLDAYDTVKKQVLANRAEHQASFYTQINQPKWHARAEMNYVGAKTEYVYNPVTYANDKKNIDAYKVANVSAGYKVHPLVDVNVRVNNVLDEQYETSYGYNTLGRNALFSVTLHSK